MKKRVHVLLGLALAMLVVAASCGGQVPATPTQQPAKPATEATKPAAEATKPAAQATKPAEPAAKPTEPAAKPAAQPAKPDPAVESFYKGKTFTIVVGWKAGGGYDLYARTLSRHIGKYIPGNPTVIVQNMPGAGGLIAANHIYNVAPKDGTTIGLIPRGTPHTQLIGGQGAQYEAEKFNWLGSMNQETKVGVFRKDSPIQKFEDAFTKTVRVGGTGPGGDLDLWPSVLNGVMGTKFELITGFPGTSDVALAIDRGELQGAFYSWSSVKSTQSRWIQDKSMNFPIQIALSKHPELQDVPLVIEFAKDEKTKNLLEVILGQLSMGRPFAAPPGVPTERVDALRKAFWAAVNDPALKEEAEKAKQEITPVSGEEIQKLVERMMKTPKDQVELLAKYIGTESK